MLRPPSIPTVGLVVLCAPLAAQVDPPQPPPADLGAELKALRQRIDELEDQQARMADRIGGRALVQAYSARSLDFGGHVTSMFSYMHGGGQDVVGHTVSLAELYVKAEIDEHWSVFVTPGFYTFHGALIDNPITAAAGDPLFQADDVTEAGVFLSRLVAQWQASDLLRVQAGIVGSPHGTTNREYFIPARTIGQGSLHTRIFLSNQLYPQIVEGVRCSGKLDLPVTDAWLEYDAYFGTQPDDPTDGIGGGRLAWVAGNVGLSFAANYGRGTRQPASDPSTNFGVLQSPFPSRVFAGRDYEFVGLDLDWRKGSAVVKGEAYLSRESGFADQRAASFEASWFFTSSVAASYRFDYYDAGSDLAPLAVPPAILPRGIATEHVAGLCYSPHAAVRLRLDFHHLELPRSDAAVNYLNLSWSLSF